MESPWVVVEVNFTIVLELLIKVPHKLPELRLGNPIWVTNIIAIPFALLSGKPDAVVIREDSPLHPTVPATRHEPPRRSGGIQQVRGHLSPRICEESSFLAAQCVM